MRLRRVGSVLSLNDVSMSIDGAMFSGIAIGWKTFVTNSYRLTSVHSGFTGLVVVLEVSDYFVDIANVFLDSIQTL